MDSNKRKFLELDVLRIMAILLVVCGHCAYTKFAEPANGLIELADTPMLHETIYLFAVKIVGLIYMFHVPLFFALSGMCYALNEHAEYSLDKFTWKKFNRLIIPFFLVGSLYMVPVKYLAKYFPDIFLAEKVFFNLEFYGHLWFLLVLFEIFMIFRLLRQYFQNSITPLIFISLVFYFVGIPKLYDLIGGQNPYLILHAVTYLIWFVLGYVIYREHDAVENYLNRYSSYALCFITAAIFLADSEYDFLPLFFKTLSGCAATYFLAICLSKTRLVNWDLYGTLLKYNFSIYLFHDPLNYLVIHAFSKWNWIETSPNLAATAFIGMRTIIICLVSVFIAYILDKSKIYLKSKFC